MKSDWIDFIDNKDVENFLRGQVKNKFDVEVEKHHAVDGAVFTASYYLKDDRKKLVGTEVLDSFENLSERTDKKDNVLCPSCVWFLFMLKNFDKKTLNGEKYVDAFAKYEHKQVDDFIEKMRQQNVKEKFEKLSEAEKVYQKDELVAKTTDEHIEAFFKNLNTKYKIKQKYMQDEDERKQTEKEFRKNIESVREKYSE